MSACSICFLLHLSFLPSIIYSSTTTFSSYLPLFFTSFLFLSLYYPSLLPLPFHLFSTLYSSIFSSFFPSSFLHHPSIFSSILYTSFLLPLSSSIFLSFPSFLSSFTLFPWFFTSSPSHIFLFSQVPLPENPFKRQHPQIFSHYLARKSI